MTDAPTYTTKMFFSFEGELEYLKDACKLWEMEYLRNFLEAFIEHECYLQAAIIRDEIKNRTYAE